MFDCRDCFANLESSLEESLDHEQLVIIQCGESGGLPSTVGSERKVLVGANRGDVANWMVGRKRDGDVMDGNDALDGPSHLAGGVDQVKQPARTIVLGTQDHFDGTRCIGDRDGRNQMGVEKVKMSGQMEGLNRIAQVAGEIHGSAFPE